MVKNLHSALKRWLISSVIIWMDSMVALYWICNPGKLWKVFVTNRVRKISEIANEFGIIGKHCPTDKNLAVVGSRGASSRDSWLVDEKQWPMQPKLETRKRASKELKSSAVEVLFTGEQQPNEWHALLEKRSYCKTLRVAGWVLKFNNKSRQYDLLYLLDFHSTSITCWTVKIYVFATNKSLY